MADKADKWRINNVDFGAGSFYICSTCEFVIRSSCANSKRWQKTLERELAPFAKIPDYNEWILIYNELRNR